MKNFYSVLFISFVLSLSAKATTITAIANNGAWTTASTWNLNRAPQNGDTIIIPTGFTVILNSQVNLANVYLNIYGTLSLDQASKLNITSPATIYVQIGGKITSTNGSPSEKIRFDNKEIYRGDDPDVLGPKIITGGNTGWQTPAQPIPLPVRFVSFTIASQQENVLVQWSTAQESNSSYFGIEKSNDGTNWSTIATVRAAGESSQLKNYSYTDSKVKGSVVYYRIKQVDIDGAYIYTAVRSLKLNNNNTDIAVTAATGNTLLVHFSNQVKSDVVINLVSMSGQVVAQKNISNPSGQFVFPVSNAGRGVYVVNVTDGKGLKVAKQVLF